MPDKARRPIAVDLFAGAGGLAMGLEQAGFDVVAAVEYDPIHALTHKTNFPTTAILCADLRSVTGGQVRDVGSLGDLDIDVVAGGPPCQGFSLMGHRVLADPRNELVFHFLRVVAELRPRLFVMENVPGMASGGHTQLLAELIDGFRSAGYEVRLPFRILNAANYGVPQDRRRLILLGSREDALLPSYPAATSERPKKMSHPAASLFVEGNLPLAPTVAEALSGLPEVLNYDSLFDTDVLPFVVRATSEYGGRLADPSLDPGNLSYARRGSAGLLTGCLRARHTELSKQRFMATAPGTTEPISHFFRLDPNGICNTLRAGTASDRGAFTSPRPIHPVQPRCITVREAARLHSFPDSFRFHRTIWHGFRQIGNAVPPLLGRSIGRELIRSLGVEVSRPEEELSIGSEAWAAHDMRQAAAHFGVSASVVPQRRRASTAAERRHAS